MSQTASLDPDFARHGTELCKESIARHSKSFALASRLFSREISERAAIVYAWCRRADDAIDETPAHERHAALATLREELDAVYADTTPAGAELASFQRVVRTCDLPRDYCEELLLGMQMDCDGVRYPDMPALLLYCHRVAGVVGLMMCHVMGLRDADARRNAAHLGIAMQLTNICRDVLEDWDRGRLYVPASLLAECGAPELSERCGEPFPREAVPPMAKAVHRLLDIADTHYRLGDLGLIALPWRCAFAVRAARHIYAAIGARVRAGRCDVTRPRAFVSRPHKIALVVRAAFGALAQAPVRIVRARPAPDTLRGLTPLRFPEDVL